MKERKFETKEIKVLNKKLEDAFSSNKYLEQSLQEAHERLETAIADIDNLHNEVLAKTVQVKQYNKQTESFKAKVEEANTKLEQKEQELKNANKYYQSQVHFT